ncbi:MAG: insulinase family protein [Microscillaceae bacterium]|nr:insulinase family protein [Microscillaceae bacterium]
MNIFVNLKKLSMLVILLFWVNFLYAQNLDQNIPLHPQVRAGKLANGLSYFVLKNEKPEKRVELRLAVNAGSMQEDEDQLGLAHFTEHMLFNGTKNFKKNDIVDYLQSVGVKFGADLNAYTSFDETVYMLPIPSDDEVILEKGFQILEDWAHQATFDPQEIDKERGVVIEEWRIGRGASQRMRDQWFPVLFKDSRYANRLPIGKKEILESFKYETIKRFYKDWYRPDLMAVIVVGDIDVDAMVKKIETHFGKITPVSNPRSRESYTVPDHTETLVKVTQDKEQPFTQILVYYKQDKLQVKTLADWRKQITFQLYNGMLNQRLDELSQKSEPPFIFAFSSYGGFIRGKDSYSSQAQVSDDGIIKGLRSVLTENKRVLTHGFNQSELDRYKKELLNGYEQQYKERNKTQSDRLVGEYLDYFLEGEAAPGIEWEYEMLQKILPGIKLEEINELPKKWISPKNRVVIVMAPEKENLKVPNESEIRAVLDEVDQASVEPYADKVVTEPLISQKPTPGKVKLQKELPSINATEITLSNGIKVILKPTDYKDDEILMSAYSFGGTSLVGDADYYSATNASTIINNSGIKNFSATDLQKLLSGQTVSVSPYISEITEGFRGNAAPKDLETLFQLVHLYFTAPRKDEEAFQSYITKQKGFLKNIASSPQFYFIDRQIKILTQNHPRGGGIPKPEDFDKINLDKSLSIYQDRFADPSDFVFFFVGNFKVEQIIPQLETYLGSIPAKNRKETFKDLGVRPPKGVIQETLNRGTDPKSQVAIIFTGEVKDEKEKYAIKALAEALTIKLIEVLREEKGGVYGTSARANTSKYPYNSYSVSISFTCAPESATDLINAALGEIKKVQDSGPTIEDLNKVKEARKRDLEKNLKENRWWLSALQEVYYEGQKMEGLSETNIQAKIDALTVKDLQNVAKKYCNSQNMISIVMNPEEKPAEEVKPNDQASGTNGNNEALKKVEVGQVINNYLNAIGGAEKLKAINTIKTQAAIEVMGTKIEMLSYKKQPAKSFMVQKMAGNEMMKIVFDGEKGSMSGMQGNQILEGEKAQGMKDQAAIFYELDYASKGISAQLEGIEKINGKDAFKVKFTGKNGETNEKWYDTQSGLVVKFKSPEGQEFLIEEYQDFSGIKVPTVLKFSAQGMDLTMKTESVEFNVPVEDRVFEIK